MEVRPLNPGQSSGYGFRGPLALVLYPMLDVFHAVVAHGSHGGIPLLTQVECIEA